MRVKRTEYRVCAAYDTETCNIGSGENTRAFPILFIDNDLRCVDLNDYYPGFCERISFFRKEGEYVAKLQEYIAWGKELGIVPIVCAYNLMFDMQPLMEILAGMYEMNVNAQSSTNVYTLDLLGDNGKPILRFWDTYHLEMRGLAAMGETCGLAKASGDWDYTLVRNQATELGEKELGYAARDVQVIPAYLCYLLHANEWMKVSDLGVRVITKTSIVRRMAANNIASIRVKKPNGKSMSLDHAFIKLCTQELPSNFTTYCLRKACFRGGFTFTSARYAGEVLRNVASLDVTSMHHTFINGRYVPVKFKARKQHDLQRAAEITISTPLRYVLDNYYQPFDFAFHARFKFVNLRLRKNSPFDKWGIALLSSSKFTRNYTGSGFEESPRKIEQENEVRGEGWHDTAVNGAFAFGKLYSADECVLHLNEIELWCVSRVYEWDSMVCIAGEVATHWVVPPDYVTLQSNMLFEMKNEMKRIVNSYKHGVPYEGEISDLVPVGIRDELRDGTCDEQFLNSYYISTVKGMFNGIYGTQAQDVFKPDYAVDSLGELYVNDLTKTTSENWDEKKPKNCRVLYTYGMRIVGGSRMHLVIALELLNACLGDRVRACGGDTDSVKLSCDADVTNEMLDAALAPLAVAARKAIDATMNRVRINYPKLASSLDGIGSFDVERCGSGYRYDYHCEYWNKCRVSISDGKSHVTCAGLPRPSGRANIEGCIDSILTTTKPETVLTRVFGYNTYLDNSVSHTLGRHKPRTTDIYSEEVTDYMGNTRLVVAHESQSLYEVGRYVGELSKATNAQSVTYVKAKYGREIDADVKEINYINGVYVVTVDGNIEFMGSE